jgi:hypothetical protein
MNKFILAVIMLFSVFTASAGTFNGEIGAQSKVLYQGQRYDVSVVNPSAQIGYTDSVGVSLSAGVQSTQVNKAVVQGLSNVSLAYTKENFQVYATQYTWLGLPNAKDFGVAGIKGMYKGVTANIESSSLNSQYASFGYNHGIGDYTVSALASAKAYQGGKAIFNNAELQVSKPLFGTVVSGIASYGGKTSAGVKIPNQLNLQVAYLF